jgi:hypothetical protein
MKLCEGSKGKRSQKLWDVDEEEWGEVKSTYQIFSSVLGRTVSEADTTGAKWRTFVIAAGAEIARQAVTETDDEAVTLVHTDPSGYSTHSTSIGTGFAYDTHAMKTEELDGLGNNVGTHGSMSRPPYHGGTMESPVDSITFDDITYGDCELDGIITPCSMVFNAGASGAADLVYMNRLHAQYLYAGGTTGTWIEYTDPDRTWSNLDTNEVWVQAGATGMAYMPGVGTGAGSDIFSWIVRQTARDSNGSDDITGPNGIASRVTRDCIAAIEGLGEGMWEKVMGLLKAPPLIDVDRHQWEGVYNYFNAGERSMWMIGAYFDAQNSDAYVVRSNVGNFILYRASRYDIRRDPILLLHEILHVLFPSELPDEVHTDLDESLVNAWNLRMGEGESWSSVTQRYLESGCDPSLQEDEIIQIQ